ncbi:MAG: hypothetical protein JO123_05455 [Ktedonobacteraceae bacterium]|nr:hypothetical protein [Ktedonobacteraceae bacterium]
MKIPSAFMRNFSIVALLILAFSVLSCRSGMPSGQTPPQAIATAQASRTPEVVATPQGHKVELAPITDPGLIHGIQGSADETYTGILWRRIAYPTCGLGERGQTLRNTIANYHTRGIRVLLTVCQPSNSAPDRFSPALVMDAASGAPDAVQCGNEEMKNNDSSVSFLYWTPRDFARFYDMCEQAVHAVGPATPVLLGSLDPHVGGIDYGPLSEQVSYLDQMQSAMNQYVHPGGHWDWHTETLGLINSWHDGYPDGNTNSLYYLFVFWAQQFHVSLSNLGSHLWVVEGTACFTGCGIDSFNSYQVAVAHILALITDVQTAMTFKVPFFYFSGKDFVSVGLYWPIGVLDLRGHTKPIRQDLAMGARSLHLSCPSGSSTVVDQEALLAKLYAGCSPESDYVQVIES